MAAQIQGTNNQLPVPKSLLGDFPADPARRVIISHQGHVRTRRGPFLLDGVKILAANVGANRPVRSSFPPCPRSTPGWDDCLRYSGKCFAYDAGDSFDLHRWITVWLLHFRFISRLIAIVNYYRRGASLSGCPSHAVTWKTKTRTRAAYRLEIQPRPTTHTQAEQGMESGVCTGSWAS